MRYEYYSDLYVYNPMLYEYISHPYCSITYQMNLYGLATKTSRKTPY